MDEKLKELHVELRSILQSAGKAGLSTGEILRDYEDITFCPLKPENFGVFADKNGDKGCSIEQKCFTLFMTKCRECLKFDKNVGKFFPKVDASTYRLQGLINRTKIRQRSRNKGKPVSASRMVDVKEKKSGTGRGGHNNPKINKYDYSKNRQRTGPVDPNAPVRRISPYKVDMSSFNRQQRPMQQQFRPNNFGRNDGYRPYRPINTQINSNHPYSLYNKENIAKFEANPNTFGGVLLSTTQHSTNRNGPPVSPPKWAPIQKSKVQNVPNVQNILPKSQTANANTSIISKSSSGQEIIQIKKLPLKMVQLYTKTVRNYNINLKKFYLKDIDKITQEITKGSKNFLDFKRYGYDSVRDLFVKNENFKKNVKVSESESASESAFLTFYESPENRQIFLNFISKMPNVKKPSGVSTTDIKNYAKQNNMAKTLKSKLNEMSFSTLNEYLEWLHHDDWDSFDFDEKVDRFILVPKCDDRRQISEPPPHNETIPVSQNDSFVTSSIENDNAVKIPSFDRKKGEELDKCEFIISKTSKSKYKAILIDYKIYLKLLTELESSCIRQMMLGKKNIPPSKISKNDFLIVEIDKLNKHRAVVTQNNKLLFFDDGIELDLETAKNDENLKFFKMDSELLVKYPRFCYDLTFERDLLSGDRMLDIEIDKPYQLKNLKKLSDSELTCCGIF